MVNCHLYGMAGYIFLDPTPYEFTATAAVAAWGTQNRLTALTAMYFLAPPPSDRPWIMSRRGLFVRTFCARNPTLEDGPKSETRNLLMPGLRALRALMAHTFSRADPRTQWRDLRFSKPIKWQHGRGGNHAEFEHLDETKDLVAPLPGHSPFFRFSHRREGPRPVRGMA